MASPSFFGEGNTPRVQDTRWRILQKILGALIDGGGGGGPPPPPPPPPAVDRPFFTFGNWGAVDESLPYDGSILTQAIYNRDSEHKFVNTAWPSVGVGDAIWQAI